MNESKLRNAIARGVLSCWRLLKVIGAVFAMLLLVFLSVMVIVYPAGLLEEILDPGAGIVYLLDIVLVALILSADVNKKDIGTRIGKMLGIGLLYIFALAFFNVFCWGLGCSALALFDVTLGIGWSTIIGLGVFIIFILLLLITIYIRDCGWHKFFENVLKMLGFLIIPVIIFFVIYSLF